MYKFQVFYMLLLFSVIVDVFSVMGNILTRVFTNHICFTSVLSFFSLFCVPSLYVVYIWPQRQCLCVSVICNSVSSFQSMYSPTQKERERERERERENLIKSTTSALTHLTQR